MKKNPLQLIPDSAVSTCCRRITIESTVSSSRTAKGKICQRYYQQEVGRFYKLAMDSVRRNKDDVKPLMPVIKEIENAKTIDQLKAIQYKYEPYGGIGEVMNSDMK